VITAGAQNGLQAIAALLLKTGMRLGAGCFTYPGLLNLARRQNVDLVALAMDEEGITPDAVETAAKSGGLGALYCIPTNDNPTTATMGVERRKAIAALARRYGFAVIEDDAYGRLREDLLPPITSFVPELGWYLVTVSKLVSPALRVGFVRAPSLRDAFALAAAVQESAVMAPPLNVALVARWLDDGSFERLVAAIRSEAAARIADAAALFGGSACWQPEGYHLWLPLGTGLQAGEVAIQAIAAGLPAVPSAAFAVDPANGLQALRISVGGSATRARIARELRRLEAMLGEPRRGLV
jgi:DNA-binding transcriptional MocR family regulator